MTPTYLQKAPRASAPPMPLTANLLAMVALTLGCIFRLA